MSLATARQRLAWPSPEQVLTPTGAGAKVLAKLAEAKIGQAVRRLPGGEKARVGVLMGNAEADATEAPVAVVCEFPGSVPPGTLWETHRLAWNFCRSPLLITLEATLIRAWTCCESPTAPPPSGLFSGHHLTQQVDQCDLGQLPSTASEQLAQSLHWVHLVSGSFLRKYPERFRRDRRADETLLANLASVREELKKRNLDSDTAHDLLARIIFIQFLFQRKDSAGVPALNERMLRQLHLEKVLSKEYKNLSEILLNYDDAYALFRWLNSRFNGDLFPGNGDTKESQEAAWHAEMEKVKPSHLKVLSVFVDGSLLMKKGQYSLWPLYSFDAIPLEFISSIYEMFVDRDKRKKGIYYTPGHLVDVVLDEVLPWEDENWNVSVLDPACGSGIFLVKAFQRVVHRWKLANGDQEPKAATLRQILEHNLLGIDLDPHAVRVASFSLYLAMCDEIDPKHYWKQVKFPRLRDVRLIHADFFQEDVPGISTSEDAEAYDLVVGNAPWGKDTITDYARQWGEKNDWPPVNEGVGTLFLPKALALTKKSGRVRMIQPAGSLLFNSIPTARKFRTKLLQTYKVEEIINLSALRFVLFTTAVSPACIVTAQPLPPDGTPILYISPKSQRNTEDGYRIVVDPGDVHQLLASEAITEPSIWSALMWGGERDLALVQRLGRANNLRKLKRDGIAHIRRGVSWGDKKGNQPEIVGMRMLDGDEALDSSSLTLDASTLPVNNDPHAHSRDSTGMTAFQLPQLLIKQSWSQESGRFQAVLVVSDEEVGPVFCTRSYTSVHIKPECRNWLDVAALVYNSRLPVYYLLLTSGRFASYRPEPNGSDLVLVPLPRPTNVGVEGFKNLPAVDAQVGRLFAFKSTEQALIDDLFEITLKDFKGDEESPGRMRTQPECDGLVHDPILVGYCEFFLKVLKTGFDNGLSPKATIYYEDADDVVPLRVVAFHFDAAKLEPIRHEKIDSVDLLKRLQELNAEYLSKSGKHSGGIYYQRVVRVYSSVRSGDQIIPTVYVIKPDQVRYWTRSAAMRDADKIAADMWESRPYAVISLASKEVPE